MKAVIFIIFSIITTNCYSANKIDSLNTKEQVHSFLSEKIDSSWRNSRIFCGSPGCGTDSFYKIDVNNDGLNDLIIDASIAMVIIDKGADKYEKLYAPDYRFIRSMKLGNANALMYYDSFWSYRDGKIGRVDTVIYKYGMLFVHHTPKYKHKINKIYYADAECNGPDCPTFNIEIHQGGIAFQDFEHVKFIGRINDSLLNAINDEINALDIDTLSDQYKINWDNKLDAKLEVWYDNGKHKQMQDEDMAYSLRLNGIREMFKELLDMDLWKRWRIDSLNDSSYRSFSQLFRDAHNNNISSYSAHIYRDTAASEKGNKSGQKMFFAIDTLGIDPFDTMNIHGNKTFLFKAVAFIQLNNDHSFVYGQMGDRPMLSAGLWNNQNDTIELNWSLDKTLSIIRSNAFGNSYFQEWVRPVPLTIEKWKLAYLSSDGKTLMGLKVKREYEY